MSKRKRASLDEDSDELLPDIKRVRLCRVGASVSCWDDLIDDVKTIIRRACPVYARIMLGMTCKAEHTAELAPGTDPPADPTTFAQSLLLSSAFELMQHLDLRRVEAAHYHRDIVHFAMEKTSMRKIQWLLTRQRNYLDDYFPFESLLPCADCIEICGRREFQGMNAFLVELLVDRAEYGLDAREFCRALYVAGAKDAVIGKFCRHFI
jgi:hypothetical protein